jgi:predicted ATPase
LRALALFFVVRRRYAEAYVKGMEILTLACQTSDGIDPVLYVEAHYVLGVTTFWQGEFLKAKDHFERALTIYDVHRHDVHTALYSQDPGVICGIRLAHLLWFVGYPHQAQQKCEETLALARKLAHPFSLGYALNYAILTCNDRNDQVMAQMFLDEAMALSRKYESQYWLNTSQIFQWRMQVERGDIDAGIAQIRASIRSYESMQLDLYRPYTLALLAQAQAKAGSREEGLATLAEALATVNHHGDRWYEAELHRLKGELLDKLDTVPSVVESCFQQAYTLAHAQQAKSLELRAAMSLSRLWQRQGKRDQARQLLAETYGWFTEGFDTADLQEAKALLDELS